MRKLFTIVAAMLLSVATFAQAPQGFSYQAVVRDAQNAIVANQSITVKITILQGADLESATEVYSEQHNVKTNQNGLFTLVVGKGDSAGSIRTVNWSKGNCYIRTKTNYGESTSQLMSVPYALFAENVAPDNIVNVLNNSEVTNKLNFVSKTDIDNFVTSADVTTTVNTALASYATTENVNTTVNSALTNYTTAQKLKDTLAVYAKLTDIPAETNLSAYATTESVTEALDNYTPTADLAAVATTGSYSDLTGTPTIPTSVSQLSDAGNYLTTTAASNTYAKPSDVTNTVNTALADYATTEDVNALVDKQITKFKGAIDGTAEGAATFSVAADRKVFFSKGNLQYQASTGTWRFAEHQYDIIGSANSNISSTYSGWIDLFGWGTSGYSSMNPYSTSGYYDNSTNGIAGTNYDWGVYNPISNGGNQGDQWRTLTIDEWYYLLFTRTTLSGIRYAKAKVHNVNGLVLLPDDWNATTYAFSNTNTPNAANQTISDANWGAIEAVGAVFLPEAGYRSGTSVYLSSSSYWAATCGNSSTNDAGAVGVSGSIQKQNCGRAFGQAVRLVREIGVQNAQNAQNAQNFGDMPLATVNLTIKSGSSGGAAGAGAVKFMGKEWSITTSSSPIEQTYKLPAYSPIIIYIKADKLNSYSSYSVSVKINGEGIDVTQLYGNQYIIGPFDPTRVNTLEVAFYTTN